MLSFLLLTSVTFSLFGFIFGLWADNFQSVAAIGGFLALCLGAIWWIFHTGWKLKA